MEIQGGEATFPGSQRVSVADESSVPAPPYVPAHVFGPVMNMKPL